MAITFNGAPIGDVLFNSVNIAHMKFNGTEVLPQTVYFVEGYAENIVDSSGNKTGSHMGDISFYGGSSPLITASVAKPSTGNVSANDNTYGFGFSASVNGLTSVSAIYKLYDDSYQEIHDVTIYPIEYFSPFDVWSGRMNVTDKTYSIHHCEATWNPNENKKSRKLRFLKYKLMSVGDFIVHIPNRLLKLILGEDGYNKLKKH